MKKPEGYDGPDVKIVSKDNNLEGEALNSFVRDLMKQNLPATGSKISIFQNKEDNDGPLTDAVLKYLSSYQQKEMRELMI